MRQCDVQGCVGVPVLESATSGAKPPPDLRPRRGTKLRPTGGRWHGVRPLSREYSRHQIGWDGEIAAEGVVEEPAPEKSGVDCEGFMASIAHNVLKAVRRLGYGTGPPGTDDPDECGSLQQPQKSAEPILDCLRSSFAAS